MKQYYIEYVSDYCNIPKKQTALLREKEYLKTHRQR